MNIKTSELFAPVYNKAFRDIFSKEHKHERWTFPGGRASCKSSFISICIVLLIIIFPKLNALVIRRYSKSMRNSVFEQIVWAIDKLRCKRAKGNGTGWKIPRSKTAALPITYIRKDGRQQQIIFAGLDDPEKLKSIKCSSGYFGILWVEEKTEVNPADLQNVKISAMRGGDVYYMFESYNPPSSARHWCNTEARQDDARRMVIKTTYLDIPREWLGDMILNDIENTKRNNPRAYENIYLGIATGTGANIFENIQLREITKDELNAFDNNYYGIDWGYYPDPFAYVQMAYNPSKAMLYIFDDYELKKHGNQQASDKLAEHLAQWYGTDKDGNCHVNFMQDRITADSAEPKSVADFRSYGWNLRGAIKGTHSKDAGYKWLQGLNKIVIDPARAPHAADEFALYEYDIDKKTGEIMTGYPEGQPDHCMAAVRYAMESTWRHAGE